VHTPRVVKSILAAGSVQIISDWFIFDYSEYIKLSKTFCSYYWLPSRLTLVSGLDTRLRTPGNQQIYLFKLVRRTSNKSSNIRTYLFDRQLLNQTLIGNIVIGSITVVLAARSVY
jgi:hypothetical protein